MCGRGLAVSDLEDGLYGGWKRLPNWMWAYAKISMIKEDFSFSLSMRKEGNRITLTLIIIAGSAGVISRPTAPAAASATALIFIFTRWRQRTAVGRNPCTAARRHWISNKVLCSRWSVANVDMKALPLLSHARLKPLKHIPSVGARPLKASKRCQKRGKRHKIVAYADHKP